MGSLCHFCVTPTHLSYRFSIFETSASALCGITGSHISDHSGHMIVPTSWWNNHDLPRSMVITGRLRRSLGGTSSLAQSPASPTSPAPGRKMFQHEEFTVKNGDFSWDITDDIMGRYSKDVAKMMIHWETREYNWYNDSDIMESKASTRVLASCHQTWRAARICPNYRWRCIAWHIICKWMIFCLHVWWPEGNKMLVNQAKDAFCSRKQCFSTNGGFNHSCWICFFC